MVERERTAPVRLYKICHSSSWEQALRAGRYLGSADDLRDGFIHFSGPDQVAATLLKHFAGQDDLMLIGVDARVLGHALKWEPSRGGTLFPYLYAPLELAAVVSEQPLARGSHGRHRLRSELAAC